MAFPATERVAFGDAGDSWSMPMSKVEKKRWSGRLSGWWEEVRRERLLPKQRLNRKP